MKFAHYYYFTHVNHINDSMRERRAGKPELLSLTIRDGFRWLINNC